MISYQAPLAEMGFLLQQVFNCEQHWQQLPVVNQVNLELAQTILQEAATFTEQILVPLNQSADQQGCQLTKGKVTTPTGFKQAYQQLIAGGWLALGGDPQQGGEPVPNPIKFFFKEMLYSSNCSFALYPILSYGAALALQHYADDAVKSLYLKPLYTGQWSGTMCLTEPQAGSDLALISCKAEPTAQGNYRVSGSKIFITGGEHDLTTNILHLVLAKLPQAPAGSKGISLFLVPKYLADDQGEPTIFNQVHCSALESKMGIKGSATCVLNFDQATGYLLSQPHQGLAAMFTMMNYERLAIGLQGLGLAEVAYQNALAYAQERQQGRHQTTTVASQGEPIISHPDIRRLLLTAKALNKAGRAFSCYLALKMDIAQQGQGQEQTKAADLVALLTPVAKAFLTDQGFKVCVDCQQVLGGYGYIQEYGLEQFVRDARIAQIYEGTNGIQALDLMLRKTIKADGQPLSVLMAEIKQDIANCPTAELKPLQDLLRLSLAELEQVTQFLLARAKQDPDLIKAGAVDYLALLGWNMYAYLWFKMARAAQQSDQQQVYKDKLATARFFFYKLLPQAKGLAETIKVNSSISMAAEVFL
jgi:alkylation response protein AidB-like acyl-CoA dehydrogenase